MEIKVTIGDVGSRLKLCLVSSLGFTDFAVTSQLKVNKQMHLFSESNTSNDLVMGNQLKTHFGLPTFF